MSSRARKSDPEDPRGGERAHLSKSPPSFHLNRLGPAPSLNLSRARSLPQLAMANAHAGPSRRRPSPPAPAVAGHWPLGTTVKVLIDPHTRSSSQDKEPILRVSTLLLRH